MVAPIIGGDADVVIGSRLLEDEAIIGGMPRWKWLGNRFLTGAENRAFRRSYSEYHTGYRAFARSSCARSRSCATPTGSSSTRRSSPRSWPAAPGSRRSPIPTRYFLEASSVPFWKSVRYGLETLGVLARFQAHERGIIRWSLLSPPAFVLAPDEHASGAR